MKTVELELPDDLAEFFGGSDEDLAREIRLAAAIEWYRRGLVSQGKAAEIAGVGRTNFLLALGRAKVDAFQITEAELKQEVERGLEARGQRLTADLPHEVGVAGDPE
jgi:predicted HTH domain antitoxin